MVAKSLSVAVFNSMADGEYYEVHVYCGTVWVRKFHCPDRRRLDRLERLLGRLGYFRNA